MSGFIVATSANVDITCEWSLAAIRRGRNFVNSDECMLRLISLLSKFISPLHKSGVQRPLSLSLSLQSTISFSFSIKCKNICLCQKWMISWPCCIQIGPFTVHKSFFCKMYFVFHYRPRACRISLFLCAENGKHHSRPPKVSNTKGYMTLGHSNWTICSLWNLFLQNELSKKPKAKQKTKQNWRNESEMKVCESILSRSFAPTIVPVQLWKSLCNRLQSVWL